MNPTEAIGTVQANHVQSIQPKQVWARARPGGGHLWGRPQAWARGAQGSPFAMTVVKSSFLEHATGATGATEAVGAYGSGVKNCGSEPLRTRRGPDGSYTNSLKICNPLV